MQIEIIIIIFWMMFAGQEASWVSARAAARGSRGDGDALALQTFLLLLPDLFL